MRELNPRFKEIHVAIFVLKLEWVWKIGAYAVVNSSKGKPLCFWPPAEGQKRNWVNDSLDAHIIVRIPLAEREGEPVDEARKKELEKLLNWDRCLELLKHEARVQSGRHLRSENPLIHVGVEGFGWNMTLSKVKKRFSPQEVQLQSTRGGLRGRGRGRGRNRGRGRGKASRDGARGGRSQKVEVAPTVGFEMEDIQDEIQEEPAADQETSLELGLELDEIDEMLLDVANKAKEDKEDYSDATIEVHQQSAGDWYYACQYSAPANMAYTSPYLSTQSHNHQEAADISSPPPAQADQASPKDVERSLDEEMTDANVENSFSSVEDEIRFPEIIDVHNPDVAEIFFSSSSSSSPSSENNISSVQAVIPAKPAKLPSSSNSFASARSRPLGSSEADEKTPSRSVSLDCGEDDELDLIHVGVHSNYENETEVQLVAETNYDREEVDMIEVAEEEKSRTEFDDELDVQLFFDIGSDEEGNEDEDMIDVEDESESDNQSDFEGKHPQFTPETGSDEE